MTLLTHFFMVNVPTQTLPPTENVIILGALSKMKKKKKTLWSLSTWWSSLQIHMINVSVRKKNQPKKGFFVQTVNF